MSDEALFEGFEIFGVRASRLDYLHACPICGQEELSHYCRVPSLFNEGEFIRYEQCRDCGTVFRNPRLPATYREARYEESEFGESAKALNPKNQFHYAFVLRRMRRYLAESRRLRLLDFGCGAGGLLLEAQKAGFDVHGLELSRDLAAHVRHSYGLPVHQGLITDSSFAGEVFDVIVSSQVFEHLVDPRGTLVEIEKHLQPSGLLLIEVPNLLDVRERLSRGRLMDDSHLFYFSATSLSWMLRELGFEVLELHQGLRPYRFRLRGDRLVPDWLSVLGERLSSAVRIRTGLSIIARNSAEG